MNLATELLVDGFNQRYELAVVVSNDGDLKGPVEQVRGQFGMPVGVLNPHPHRSWALSPRSLPHRRAGWVFLAMATLIAASRVLSGMHYPTDVLAGGVIGLGCGYVTACIAMRPLLLPLVDLASMATDPVTRAARETKLVRATLLDPHTRAGIVLAIGLGLLAMFAIDLRSHLFDEMDLSVLTAWGAVVLAATKFAAGGRFHLPR